MIFTESEPEIIHIIFAWKINRHERRYYYGNRRYTFETLPPVSKED